MTKKAGCLISILVILVAVGAGAYYHYATLPTRAEKLAFLNTDCQDDMKKKVSNSEAEVTEMCDCLTRVYEENLPDYFIDDLYQTRKTNDTIKMAELTRKMFGTPAVSRAIEKNCKKYFRPLVTR